MGHFLVALPGADADAVEVGHALVATGGERKRGKCQHLMSPESLVSIEFLSKS